MANKITISISKELNAKLKERIKETNFKSIQDYVLYILNQIISKEEIGIKSERKQAYSAEEEKDIAGDEDMLKSLQPYSKEEELALKKDLDDMGYI